MPTLMFYNGQVLFRNGELAMDPACCCDDCCASLPDTLYGRFTNNCSAVDLTFIANNTDCDLTYECEPGIDVTVGKCWSTDEVEITCGESAPNVGVCGACNSTRTGRFILLCGTCPGDTQTRMYMFATGFCVMVETCALCGTGEPDCSQDDYPNCTDIAAGRTWTKKYRAFPCDSCRDPCECNLIEVWK